MDDVIYAPVNLPYHSVVEHQENYFLVPIISGGWKDWQPYLSSIASLRTLDEQEVKQIAARIGLGHGGYRVGAGRTTIGDNALLRRTVTLSAADVAYLSELGEGNLSAGIREAVKYLHEQYYVNSPQWNLFALQVSLQLPMTNFFLFFGRLY